MQFLEVLSWRQFYCPSLWCSGWCVVPTVSKIVHELLEIMQQLCSAQRLIGTGANTPASWQLSRDVWVSLNI